jgi:type VI secretion system protein VasD
MVEGRRRLIGTALAGATILAGCSTAKDVGSNVLGSLLGNATKAATKPGEDKPDKPKEPDKPKPTLLEAILVSSASINPDLNGRPSPVLVRVFVLKNSASFESADMIALFEHERDALAADLIDKEEIVVKPDETRALERTLAPEATALGFAVEYRDVDHAAWRLTVPLHPGERNRLVARLDGIRVTVAAP